MSWANVKIGLQEGTSQTEELQTKEEDVQTYLIEQIDEETQSIVETKNERIQTPKPSIVEKDIQTEELLVQ